jgi:hypothetical protein
MQKAGWQHLPPVLASQKHNALRLMALQTDPGNLKATMRQTVGGLCH